MTTKLDVRRGRRPRGAIAQDVLRRVALAGVADDDEREVAGGAPADVTANAPRRPVALLRRHCPHHRLAPGVGARLGPGVPHAGRPVLGVEVPAHAPDRDGGGDDGRERQAAGRPRASAARHRVAGFAEPHPDPQPIAQPPFRDAMPPARALRAERQVPAPHAALDPARRPAQRQHDRSDDRQREQDGEQHVAQHGNRGRDIPEQRAIRLHARDVDREQRGHKGQRPPSVARRARPFLGDDLLEQGHGFGTIAQAQIVDDRAPGIIGHVNRRDGDRPGDAAHAQRRGNGDRPVRRHVACRQEQRGDRQIAHRGDAGDELFTTRGGAPRGDGLTKPVERERGGQEEEQRSARDEGRVDEASPINTVMKPLWTARRKAVGSARRTP